VEILPLGLRWTIGNVAPRGFEALRLSLLGAFKVFGPTAAYVVYVNTLSVAEAKQRTGPLRARLEARVEWRDASSAMPGWLSARFANTSIAEGTGWKLAPVRAFTDRFELALDNDVVLWAMPPACRTWLSGGASGALVSEDVASCFGGFAEYAGEHPVNLGLRGLAPGVEFEQHLRDVLTESGRSIVDSNDEQGLQLAALRRRGEPERVTLKDVTICSPFPPHVPHLGECGAHFVGLNTHLPWNYYDRPADSVRAEHWDSVVDELRRRVES
jgi:hypothetical protein